MPNGPSRCNFLESIKTKRAGLGTAKEPQKGQKGQKGQMGYWDIGILGSDQLWCGAKRPRNLLLL